MLGWRELTNIGKVWLKSGTGLVLLLCNEAGRHGEPRVRFVARNSKGDVFGQGLHECPRARFQRGFFSSEDRNKLILFSLSKRNFKDNLITDYKSSHRGEVRSVQSGTIQSSVSSDDKRILKVKKIMREYLWKILWSVLLQDCVKKAFSGLTINMLM